MHIYMRQTFDLEKRKRNTSNRRINIYITNAQQQKNDTQKEKTKTVALAHNSYEMLYRMRTVKVAHSVLFSTTFNSTLNKRMEKK